MLSWTSRTWIIRAGLVAFVLLGVFPPWVERMDVPYRVHVERSEGYGLIVSPPTPWLGGVFDYRASVQVDWSRLLLEWIVLAGIVGVVLIWPSSGAQQPGSNSDTGEDSPVPLTPEELERAREYLSRPAEPMSSESVKNVGQAFKNARHAVEEFKRHAKSNQK